MKKSKLIYYVIKYIYVTENFRGKKKNRFGDVSLELDATPEQIKASKKLHNFLADKSHCPKGHRMLSIQITDITSFEETPEIKKTKDFIKNPNK